MQYNMLLKYSPRNALLITTNSQSWRIFEIKSYICDLCLNCCQYPKHYSLGVDNQSLFFTCETKAGWREEREEGKHGEWNWVEVEEEEMEEGEKASPQLVLLSARGFQKNTQSSLHYAHVRSYTHTHAGGTKKCCVPICCAPGPLSGDSQTGIQPCQDWHWSH